MSQAADVQPTPELLRETLNPFEGASWMDFFEELTYNYMRPEDRPWQPPGPHHERWFEDFSSGRDLIRLAHRSSLKTTSTLAYLIANLEYRPGFHTAWIGNNETLAYEKAHSEFNKLVGRNPWLVELQEDRREVDAKSKKEFPNDSSLSVGWLYGGTEGRHADVLAVDDLIKEKGDGDWQEIEDWLSSVIVPVQEHGGQTVVIGTRKAQTDIYHLLADREGFDFVEYPAVLEVWDAEFREEAADRRPDPGLYHEAPHPLDPDRTANVLWEQRGTEYLAGNRSKQSEHTWMREFCLVVQTREGAVYAVYDPTRNRTSDDPDDALVHFTGLDWGSGNPAGFVQFAVELGEDDRAILRVVDERKFPAEGTHTYTDTLGELHREWGVGPVGCDPSDKRGVLDLRGEGLDAIPADNDVDGGIRAVKDLFASERLTIHERCTELLEELGAYRYNPATGRPVDRNDHLLDALRYGVMLWEDRLRRLVERRRHDDVDTETGVSYL